MTREEQRDHDAPWSTELVTEPAALPLDLVEVKRHLRLETDETDEDAILSLYLAAVVAEIEGARGVDLVTRTRRLWLDAWPEAGHIRIPHPPLQQVLSITYYLETGTTSTLATTVYRADTVSFPGRVVLADDDQVWPTDRPRPGPAVAVEFVSGFATPFTAVASTDVLTLSGRSYSVGDAVQVWNSGGALPAPLAELTVYYVVSPSGATLKLAAASGGSALNIADAGTGLHFIGRRVPATMLQAMRFLLAQWYEHREAVIETTRGQFRALPLAIESLLGKVRDWSF